MRAGAGSGGQRERRRPTDRCGLAALVVKKAIAKTVMIEIAARRRYEAELPFHLTLVAKILRP